VHWAFLSGARKKVAVADYRNARRLALSLTKPLLPDSAFWGSAAGTIINLRRRVKAKNFEADDELL
jgi:hypothetical protein